MTCNLNSTSRKGRVGRLKGPESGGDVYFPVSIFQFPLQRRIPALIVANTDGVVHVRQEHFSVADLPGLRGS